MLPYHASLQLLQAILNELQRVKQPQTKKQKTQHRSPGLDLGNCSREGIEKAIEDMQSILQMADSIWGALKAACT
jgi:hypothetical protein